MFRNFILDVKYIEDIRIIDVIRHPRQRIDCVALQNKNGVQDTLTKRGNLSKFCKYRVTPFIIQTHNVKKLKCLTDLTKPDWNI